MLTKRQNRITKLIRVEVSVKRQLKILAIEQDTTLSKLASDYLQQQIDIVNNATNLPDKVDTYKKETPDNPDTYKKEEGYEAD